MALKCFPFLLDGTRLLRHKDCLYKVKFFYKNIPLDESLDESWVTASINSELEEIVLAVIHMAQMSGHMDLIQTENFYVQPTLKSWKAQQKLGFCQHGKDLRVYKNVITLVLTPHFSGELWKKQQAGENRNNSAQNVLCPATQHNQPNVIHLAARGSKQPLASMLVSLDQTSPSADGKKVQAAANKSDPVYVTEMPETKISAPQNLVTNTEPAVSSSNSSNKAAAKAGVRKSPHASRGSGKEIESPVAMDNFTQNGKYVSGGSINEQTLSTSPNYKRLRSLQDKNPPPATVHRASRINYSIRNQVSQKKKLASSQLIHSTLYPGHQKNQPNLDSVLKRNENNSNIMPEKSPVSKQRNKPELQFLVEGGFSKRSDHFPETKSPKLTQKHGKSDNAQDSTRQSSRTNVQRSTMPSCSNLQRPQSPRQTQSPRTSTRQTRSITTRNTLAEENQRLQALISQSPAKQLCREKTFYQKDRYVIEQGDLQEELKLQQLAGPARETEEESRVHGKKRRRNLVDVVTDSLVTPIKRMLGRRKDGVY